MSIVLMDTCVFCNVLDVPSFNQHRDQILAEFEAYLKCGATLLLPMAAVLETGNHIAQISNGGMRRKVAERFRDKVSGAIDGSAPWTPTPFWETDHLRGWLVEFPDQAMRGAEWVISPSSRSGRGNAICFLRGGWRFGATMAISKVMIVPPKSRHPPYLISLS